MADLRPPLDLFFREFGAAAVITVPGGMPVTATVILSEPKASRDDWAHPLGPQMPESAARVTVRRNEITSLPNNTVVQIGAKAWHVTREHVVDGQEEDLVVAGVR